MDAFIKYIKGEDLETCVNSLFVLTNSEPEKLDHLMESLNLTRKELIEMMAHVLKANIDEYKETMRYFYRGGGSFKFGYMRQFNHFGSHQGME